MRTIAFCLAILSYAFAANAQTTFNYFDPADVDEYGFLWFDTQAKLEKYCGVSSDFKVRLIPATYNDSTGQPAKPSLDATVRGWNLEGVLGGDGSHTGAIILPETDFSITWLTEVNGGGIPITAYIINNNKTKWYIHGIRAYTYTDTWASMRDISTTPLDIKVKGSTITTADSAAIEVCSTTGTALRRGRGTIDCSTLPHGIYIIKATDGKTTLTRKIVF